MESWMEGDLDGVKRMGYSQTDCKHILIILRVLAVLANSSLTDEVYAPSHPGLLSNSKLSYKASKCSRRVYIVFWVMSWKYESPGCIWDGILNLLALGDCKAYIELLLRQFISTSKTLVCGEWAVFAAWVQDWIQNWWVSWCNIDLKVWCKLILKMNESVNLLNSVFTNFPFIFGGHIKVLWLVLNFLHYGAVQMLSGLFLRGKHCSGMVMWSNCSYLTSALIFDCDYWQRETKAGSNWSKGGKAHQASQWARERGRGWCWWFT